MKQHLQRIYSKLDQLDKKIDENAKLDAQRTFEFEKQLIVYNDLLNQHIKGVNQAREEIDIIRMQFDQEVKPLTKIHENEILLKNLNKKRFKNISAAIGLISMIVGSIYASYLLYQSLTG